MNLIKIYGDLKYQLANIENNIFQCGGTKQDITYELKTARLIHIIEYRFKILNWKPINKQRFREKIELL